MGVGDQSGPRQEGWRQLLFLSKALGSLSNISIIAPQVVIFAFSHPLGSWDYCFWHFFLSRLYPLCEDRIHLPLNSAVSWSPVYILDNFFTGCWALWIYLLGCWILFCFFHGCRSLLCCTFKLLGIIWLSLELLIIFAQALPSSIWSRVNLLLKVITFHGLYKSLSNSPYSMRSFILWVVGRWTIPVSVNYSAYASQVFPPPLLALGRLSNTCIDQNSARNLMGSLCRPLELLLSVCAAPSLGVDFPNVSHLNLP
jgi:hypothetical protein